MWRAERPANTGKLNHEPTTLPHERKRKQRNQLHSWQLTPELASSQGSGWAAAALSDTCPHLKRRSWPLPAGRRSRATWRRLAESRAAWL